MTSFGLPLRWEEFVYGVVREFRNRRVPRMFVRGEKQAYWLFQTAAHDVIQEEGWKCQQGDGGFWLIGPEINSCPTP